MLGFDESRLDVVSLPKSTSEGDLFIVHFSNPGLHRSRADICLRGSCGNTALKL